MVLITMLNPFFPVAGMQTPGASFNMLESIIDVLWHMLVPLLVVTLTLFGQYVLVLRSSMKNVLVEDFILTARAKGLRELRVIKDHAIKNAILPFITLATISMGWVVAGSLQTEIIFSWPGIGRLVWDALLYRDYPLLQGCFLVLAISTILASFFADILYAFLDPRIRYGE
jgi:peptide/nickel transport system permease protein